MGLVTTYGVHANLLQSCLNVTGLELARLLCPWDPQAGILEWLQCHPQEDPPDPLIEPGSQCLLH